MAKESILAKLANSFTVNVPEILTIVGTDSPSFTKFPPVLY